MHRDIGHAAAFGGKEWTVVETAFDPARAAQAESVLAVGNGFLGARGRLEEDDGAVPAVYLNGVYETLPIHYHEKAPGFATASDSRLPVPSGLAIAILIDEVPVDHAHGAFLAHERVLDLRTGVLYRRFTWRAPSGRRFEIATERLASFDDPSLLALSVDVTALDGAGDVQISSRLVPPAQPQPDTATAVHDPRVGPALDAHSLISEAVIDEADAAGLIQRARMSGHGVACLMAHDLGGPTPTARRQSVTPAGAKADMTIALAKGESVRLVKYVAYASDRGNRDSDMLGQARSSLARALARGFA
ncbi:MAG: beta-phosphoglucomutase, partial [Alphaproteobacteria bacterium]